VKQLLPDLSFVKVEEVAKIVYTGFIMFIDAHDNGIQVGAGLNISQMISEMVPTEGKISDQQLTDAYFRAMEFIAPIFRRFVWSIGDSQFCGVAHLAHEAKMMETYDDKKRILVIEDNKKWSNLIYEFEKEYQCKVIYGIYPRLDGQGWNIKATHIRGKRYKPRLPFPKKFCGLSGLKLDDVSGMPEGEMIFCHRQGFIAGAKTKQSAIVFAKLALDYCEESSSVDDFLLADASPGHSE
jgi:uncharacterized UPF0160 family protein